MILEFIHTTYPILFLIAGLVYTMNSLGQDILNGSAQVLLVSSGLLAVLPEFLGNVYKKGLSKKETWRILFQAYHYSKESIQNVIGAIGILILVGMLIPSWSSSGILPSLTLLGLKGIHPDFFLAASCFVSAGISLASGSSWSTAGTIGLALMSMGGVMGYPLPLVAGAILSGAYFGDKLSPMSDTTNLASAISRVRLSQHIRYMLPTTLLSFVLSLGLYAALGFFYESGNPESHEILQYLTEKNPPAIWKIGIPFLVLLFVGMGFPAIPSLSLGVFSAWLVSYFEADISLFDLWNQSIYGYKSNTGIPLLDELYSGGGILSMLPTIFLILSAMVFGGCMEGSGKIRKLILLVESHVRKPQELVLTTMFFSYLINLTTSDQYLSLVIPGRTLRDLYGEFGVDRRQLSRALEDSGTVTSVLIPWNSCGAFMSTTLSVPVLSYLPYCFFHWIQILLSLILALWKMKKDKPFEKKK